MFCQFCSLESLDLEVELEECVSHSTCQVCCNLCDSIFSNVSKCKFVDSLDDDSFETGTTFGISLILLKKLIYKFSKVVKSEDNISKVLSNIRQKSLLLIKGVLKSKIKEFEVVNITCAESIINFTFKVVENKIHIDQIYLCRNHIYIGGRYNKLCRNISQSPWSKKNSNIISSVEEILMGPIKKFFDCERCVFSSSGREDVDVQMLGDGRPFVIEIVGARKITIDLTSLENTINYHEYVKTSPLFFVSKNIVKKLRMTQDRNKSYRVVIDCFSNVKNSKLVGNFNLLSKIIQISQKTPIRVLHTRTNMIRIRNVTILVMDEFANDTIVLDINSQSGTYIKEFVNGDMNRTVPSLKQLLKLEKCNVTSLDVISIDLIWPTEEKCTKYKETLV